MTFDLTLSDLRVTSARGRCLLDIPHLAISAGSCVAVAGPSGAGKTTLLQVLAGVIRPQNGRVTWGTANLGALSDVARTAFRAAHIGMVFQEFLLFDELSAQQNAALSSLFHPKATRAAIRARAEAHLAQLGLPSEPRAVWSLSGGERQRVAVARALAADPPILLADEPTASLDRARADALGDDLVGLCRAHGKTLIVVSHDLGLQARMDRVITLADGRVVEDGAP